MSSVSVGAEAPRRREPGLRRPDDVDRERPRELREDRGVQAHGSRALDDDGVAQGDPGALDGVKAGRQAATAAEKVFDADSLGQRHAAGRPEESRSAPTTRRAGRPRRPP